MTEITPKNSFEILTDKEKVLMTVIAAVDFTKQDIEDSDHKPTLRELVDTKSELHDRIADFIRQSNGLPPKAIVKDADIHKALGNLSNLTLHSVVDHNKQEKNGTEPFQKQY